MEIFKADICIMSFISQLLAIVLYFIVKYQGGKLLSYETLSSSTTYIHSVKNVLHKKIHSITDVIFCSTFSHGTEQIYNTFICVITKQYLQFSYEDKH